MQLFAEHVQENPLLQAWGAAGRDFMALVGDYEVVHPLAEITAYADPLDSGRRTLADGGLGDSLLRRMQSDLFHRRAPAVPALLPAVNLHDPSLQVHACHTRLRELQVLHDQLRALLDDPRFDPPLQPREIAVLSPNIDRTCRIWTRCSAAMATTMRCPTRWPMPVRWPASRWPKCF